MNLFIDSVSPKGFLALFNDSREIVEQQYIEVQGNESQKLGQEIQTFLNRTKTSLEQIENIVIVNGPGSFTGIRTAVLIVNTFAFVFPHITLTPISYFSLFSGFPILKQSSKRDVFFFGSENEEVKILSNEEAMVYLHDKHISKLFGDVKEEIFPDIFIEKEPNYATICKSIEFDDKKKINPLYIKKPNIT